MLLLNFQCALRWDKRLNKRQVMEPGQLLGILQRQVAGAEISSAFESPHLLQSLSGQGLFPGAAQSP